MKRTRRQSPYDDVGKTNFPARNVPGVYLIWYVRLGREVLRYVGFSRTDVYKALYRHFQEWNDQSVARGERNERITYSNPDHYRVRVVYCRTAGEAAELERALIIKHQPVDNPDKLEGYTLTEHGEELVGIPDSAPFVRDLEAPF